MVSKEFIPYEEALALKELGFNEKECLGFWSKIHGLFITKTTGELNENAGECKAPLYQQAFRWFREEYGIVHTIYKVKDDYVFGFDVIGSFHNNSTYEEAQDACLRKLIEIVKENM